MFLASCSRRRVHCGMEHTAGRTRHDYIYIYSDSCWFPSFEVLTPRTTRRSESADACCGYAGLEEEEEERKRDEPGGRMISLDHEPRTSDLSRTDFLAGIIMFNNIREPMILPLVAFLLSETQNIAFQYLTGPRGLIIRQNSWHHHSRQA
jgi:hypothetical protein